jgi:CTP synthase
MERAGSKAQTRFVVVVGGVMSGVGKGVATASIARILKEYGYATTAIKVDPYINCDAGTLRPTEHGEVWVTDDGGEIDQDLGNYERFLGHRLPKRNNITTGQIYRAVIERERRGEYDGQTVQLIPHIPDEIKDRLWKAAANCEIALLEIGGTVGDYENIPFLFAARSLQRELGKERVLYILITYLPIPGHIEEMKTKPTQQAIKMLTENGILPDIILCRAKTSLDSVRKKKIETYVNIPAEFVISAPDASTLYEVPLNLEREELGAKILCKLGLSRRKTPDWTWLETYVSRVTRPSRRCSVAIVGKYVDIGDYALSDSYLSINQALEHAGAFLNTQVDITWLDAKTLEPGDDAARQNEILSPFGGIIVPGGFGAAGVEGKIAAIRYARQNNVPFLGLCYGLQWAVVEFARNVLGHGSAHSTEVAPKTDYPVIDLLPEQKGVLERSAIGGTMRLGAYRAWLREGTQVHSLYTKTGRIKKDVAQLAELEQSRSETFRLGRQADTGEPILERHRHRYEVVPGLVEELERGGMAASGVHVRSDGETLLEFVELPGHPFFIGTQAHPEFKSGPDDPAPVFLGLVGAMTDAD